MQIVWLFRKNLVKFYGVHIIKSESKSTNDSKMWVYFAYEFIDFS